MIDDPVASVNGKITLSIDEICVSMTGQLISLDLYCMSKENYGISNGLSLVYIFINCDKVEPNVIISFPQMTTIIFWNADWLSGDVDY